MEKKEVKSITKKKCNSRQIQFDYNSQNLCITKIITSNKYMKVINNDRKKYEKVY